MAETFQLACVQMTSGQDIAENTKVASEYIRKAVSDGAQFVATPEVTDQVISNRAEKIDQAFDQNNHPSVEAFAKLADELSIWLLAGSLCIRCETIEGPKIANRSFLFSPSGKIVAAYDKIHLFDVQLPTGESHTESAVFQAGDVLHVVETDHAKVGMSVCYDMRFPHIYRDMAKQGAELLCIPAAFTVPTGKAHWEVLLRARAIECGAFVVAPAQCGDHQGARQTYGHSMIIGPWGDILAQKDEKPGVITADIDLSEVEKARAAIPALQHDRDYQKA